jgi:folate-binding protein YgfZ
MPVTLPPPQLLEIVGADAAAFAHAQFCNDVIALPSGHWQWNAWLSPQGRVRYFFILLRDAEDRLRLLLRGGDAETMRVALARFVFRAKVAMRVIADVEALGCDGAEALAALDTLPSGDTLASRSGSTGLRLPGSTPRWLLLGRPGSTEATSSDEALNRWRLDDIGAGLPEVPAVLEDQFLPQWLGLGRLDAINVRKGCYPGQEIMARLHFKGGNKRGLYRIELCCDALPAPGTALLATIKNPSGVVVMAAWTAVGHAEALVVFADATPVDAVLTDPRTATDIKVVSAFA